MSKRSYRKRAHPRPVRRDVQVGVAAQYACTSDDDRSDIEEARRQAHDSLIARLGARRRSGVTWYVVRPDRRERFLDDAEGLDDDGTGGTVSYDDLRGWFDEHPDGWLIVATCKAVHS